MAKNIYEKIWDAHVVHTPAGQDPILYIDRHFVHEVTSPQAFEGLRLAGRGVRCAGWMRGVWEVCVRARGHFCRLGRAAVAGRARGAASAARGARVARVC